MCVLYIEKRRYTQTIHHSIITLHHIACILQLAS